MEEIERSHILTGLLLIVYALFVSYYSKDFPNAHSFQIKSFVLGLAGLILFVPALVSTLIEARKRKNKGVNL
ncbi:hypothetical protein HYT26_04870 [Candidatus Pacearchaeota archaeon]|nr:hypothetical protein [Candidatus Pacearchaeota archaeon]